jgi:hypothetical protein
MGFNLAFKGLILTTALDLGGSVTGELPSPALFWEILEQLSNQ